MSITQQLDNELVRAARRQVRARRGDRHLRGGRQRVRPYIGVVGQGHAHELLYPQQAGNELAHVTPCQACPYGI